MNAKSKNVKWILNNKEVKAKEFQDIENWLEAELRWA